MSKSTINFNQESEIALSKAKTIGLERGIDVSNKEKLVNFALELLNEKLSE